MRSFILPCQILCKVVNVQGRLNQKQMKFMLKLYCLNQIKVELVVLILHHQNLKSRVHSFCKTFNSSNMSIHGDFSVLRTHVDDCLPPLASI
ncbi:hypothetical protein Tsubulata_045958 [Turnera subulata]|uniref:Uncharacterized protein n=1 Tax=Turnera subulata TaxID=218843 RepID=A0A9Q0F0F7_9ROSI|nr:hypothetical protein Tsubulata_045958 [Turnera subulata]